MYPLEHFVPSQNFVLQILQLHYHYVLLTKYCSSTIIVLHSILAACAALPFPYSTTLYLPYLDPVPFLLCFSGMYPAWHIAGNLFLTCIFKFGFGVAVQGMPVSLQGVVLNMVAFCLLSLYIMQFGFLVYENGAAVEGICMLRD